MGIPRFAYRMREFARTEILRRTDGTCPMKIAIIDGPSLAHFISFESTRNGVDDQAIYVPPDYAKLAHKAVEWVDRLQSYGFEIEGIYFDGALPTYKKGTRLERLQNYVDNLVRFKSIHTEVRNATRISRRPAASNGTHRIQIAQSDLASPPFLVCAVVEALLESQYAERTWVVPGEADPFCAVAARSVALIQPDAGVTIFTNDSDLIIYDIGPQSRVVMINSIDEVVEGGDKAPRALQFLPSELRRLSPEPLPDLIRPAYEMLDPSVSFREALAKSGFNPCSPEYVDFANSYSLDRPTQAFEDLKASREREREIIQTDARISELIYQAIEGSHLHLKTEKQRDVSFRGCAIGRFHSTLHFDSAQDTPTIGEHARSTEFQMYLPTLFEDPARSSAWKMGVPLRNAADSLIKKMFHLKKPILEYRRSGNSIHGVKVECSSDDDTTQNLATWENHIDKAIKRNKDLDSILRWRLLIMEFTFHDLEQENSTLPTTEDILHVLTNKAPVTWHQVHLSAQFQAEYYSLRMLKEILRFHFQQHLHSSHTSGSYQACADSSEQTLYEQLRGLPSISSFFSFVPEEMADGIGRKHLRTTVEDLLVAIDPDSVKQLQQQREASQRQKRKKRRSRQIPSTMNAEGQGIGDNNPFSALAES